MRCKTTICLLLLLGGCGVHKPATVTVPRYEVTTEVTGFSYLNQVIEAYSKFIGSNLRLLSDGLLRGVIEKDSLQIMQDLKKIQGVKKITVTRKQ